MYQLANMTHYFNINSNHLKYIGAIMLYNGSNPVYKMLFKVHFSSKKSHVQLWPKYACLSGRSHAFPRISREAYACGEYGNIVLYWRLKVPKAVKLPCSPFFSCFSLKITLLKIKILLWTMIFKRRHRKFVQHRKSFFQGHQSKVKVIFGNDNNKTLSLAYQ